jgi:peptide/nickel transport system substrate-binding protein
VVLEANDRYILGRPKLDLIEVRFILDTNVIVANVLAGEVQLTVGRGLTIEQAILVRGEWRRGTVDTPLIQHTSLWPQFLNPDPPVMLDLRFRRALYHALDRQQIVDTFLDGLVPVANSIINPDMPEFNAVEPHAARYPYDPSAARRLIEEIPSISREADGFYYERATGRKISLEITTRADNLREKLMPVMADMWARVGVAADPVVIPEQLATNPAVRAEFRSLWFVFNPADINRYRISETPLPENRFRGANYNRYRNAELDGLIDRYNLTIPIEERNQVLAQVIRHMTENVIVMPLFHDSEPVLINERLVNAKGRRGMAVQTWNAHEWDLS